MDNPLSDADIKRRLTGVPVIKYSDLRKLSTLPDVCIILLEWQKNGIGHWVALFHIENEPYYFNSFGERYDNDLNCLSRSARIILGESGNEIQRLLNGAPCEYNRVNIKPTPAQHAADIVLIGSEINVLVLAHILER